MEEHTIDLEMKFQYMYIYTYWTTFPFTDSMNIYYKS